MPRSQREGASSRANGQRLPIAPGLIRARRLPRYPRYRPGPTTGRHRKRGKEREVRRSGKDHEPMSSTSLGFELSRHEGGLGIGGYKAGRQHLSRPQPTAGSSWLHNYEFLNRGPGTISQDHDVEKSKGGDGATKDCCKGTEDPERLQGRIGEI